MRISAFKELPHDEDLGIPPQSHYPPMRCVVARAETCTRRRQTRRTSRCCWRCSRTSSSTSTWATPTWSTPSFDGKRCGLLISVVVALGLCSLFLVSQTCTSRRSLFSQWLHFVCLMPCFQTPFPLGVLHSPPRRSSRCTSSTCRQPWRRLRGSRGRGRRPRRRYERQRRRQRRRRLRRQRGTGRRHTRLG